MALERWENCEEGLKRENRVETANGGKDKDRLGGAGRDARKVGNMLGEVAEARVK